MILEKNIDIVGERAILLMVLGSLRALEHKAITIDESQRILFFYPISQRIWKKIRLMNALDIIKRVLRIRGYF